ncbi:MAG: hypothetical protein AAGJ83_15980, partial [Planctomycetota bacterium]
MRITNCRPALLAMVAALFAISGNASADHDFNALLADVSFGQDATTPAAKLTGKPTSTTALVMPQASAAEDLPVPPAPSAVTAPVTENAPAAPMAAATQPHIHPAPAAVSPGMPLHVSPAPYTDACSQCNPCKKKHFESCFGEARCQPYTTPQLPVSTFYQYWRTNACNVNVWNGFRNRCHTTIDLSIHKKSHCDTCGGCEAIDCGPQPAEWCDQPCATDACD